MASAQPLLKSGNAKDSQSESQSDHDAGLARTSSSAAAPLPPIEAYSWPTQFLFLFMTPVFSRAVNKGRLTFKDIHPCGTQDDPVLAFASAYRKRGVVASFRALHAQLGARWWWSGFLLLVSTIGTLALPIAIQGLLDVLDAPVPSARKWVPYAWACGIFGASALCAVTIHRFWWESTRVGLHSQLILSGNLLTKTLGLGGAARAARSRGELLNLLTTDAGRLCDSFVWCGLHWQTWASGLQLAVAVYYLWALLGTAGLVGSGALCLFVPATSLLQRAALRLSARVQTRRDARGKLVGEMVAGIATLKVYGWVEAFLARVHASRDDEMRAIRAKQLLTVVTDVLAMGLPVLVLAGMLALFTIWEPGKLTPAIAFSTVNWVSTIQFPLRTVPYMLVTINDCVTSLRRLRALFAEGDADVSALDSWTRVLPPAVGGAAGDAKSAAVAVADGTHAQAAVPMRGWLDLRRIPSVLDEAEADGRPMTALAAAQAAKADAAAASEGAAPSLMIELRGACFGWSVPAAEADASAATGTTAAAAGAADASAPLLAARSEAVVDVGAAMRCPSCSCPCRVVGAAAAHGPAERAGPATAADADASHKVAGSAVVNTRSAHSPSASVLHNVSLSCPRGSVTVIAGVVGSGKSTLLQGLIGEAERLAGNAHVRGRVAYCAESPWILNRTLRENITFIDPLRPDWYDTVVSACALDVDAAALRDGYDTLIGDQGVTLSGGQKHRVALARALYADADVYILDDVLGAVDAATASTLWEQGIIGLLAARGKTVIMATHAVHFAARPEVTQVVVLAADGSVAACGPYREVTRSPAAAEVLAAEVHRAASREPEADEVSIESAAAAAGAAAAAASVPTGAAGAGSAAATADAAAAPSSAAAAPVVEWTAGSLSGAKHADRADAGTSVAAAPGATATASVALKPRSEAERAQEGLERYQAGAVQARHILRYIRRMGSPLFLAWLGLLFAATQAVTVATSFWMAQWVAAPSADSQQATQAQQPEAGTGNARNVAAATTLPLGARLLGIDLQPGSAAFYAVIYGCMNAGLALATFLRSLSLTFGEFQSQAVSARVPRQRCLIISDVTW